MTKNNKKPYRVAQEDKIYTRHASSRRIRLILDELSYTSFLFDGVLKTRLGNRDRKYIESMQDQIEEIYSSLERNLLVKYNLGRPQNS